MEEADWAINEFGAVELGDTRRTDRLAQRPAASLYGRGLLVHTTLAITPDRLPLGLLAQQDWARGLAWR